MGAVPIRRPCTGVRGFRVMVRATVAAHSRRSISSLVMPRSPGRSAGGATVTRYRAVGSLGRLAVAPVVVISRRTLPFASTLPPPEKPPMFARSPSTLWISTSTGLLTGVPPGVLTVRFRSVNSRETAYWKSRFTEGVPSAMLMPADSGSCASGRPESGEGTTRTSKRPPRTRSP